jgi:hypothetical protein
MGRHVKYREIDGAANSILIPKGSTAEQPASPQAGQFRYNETVNGLEFYNGTQFVQLQGAVGASATITRDSFTLDGSTAAYGPLSFEPNADQNVLVFIDGIFQNDTQYNISGTTITLSSILEADNGKTLVVLHGFDAV